MSRFPRFVALFALLQCCGSSCGDPNAAVPEPPPARAPVPYLRAESGTLTLRVRVSKPELSVDCGGTSWAVPISDQLFGPAHEVTLGSAPVPLFRAQDRPASEQGCTLLELDLPQGPSVVRLSPGSGEYALTRDSDGKLTVQGASVVNGAAGEAPACTRTPRLTWSESTVTGPSLIEAVETLGTGGCTKLRLRPASSEGPSLTWLACLSGATFPFVTGDPVRIVQNENPSTHVRVVRMERMRGERLVAWLLRGPPGALPAAGWDSKLFALSSSQRGDACRPELRENCGSVEIPDDVTIGFGQRSLLLKSGESVDLMQPEGRRLHVTVVHSLFRPVVDPACSKDVEAAPADVGLFVVEQGGGSANPAEIAAPAAAVPREPPAGRAPCKAPGASDPKAVALACYQSRVRPALLDLAKSGNLARYAFGDRKYLLDVLALKPELTSSSASATAPAPESIANDTVLGEPSALGPAGSFVIVQLELSSPRMPADGATLFYFYVDKASLETRLVHRVPLG